MTRVLLLLIVAVALSGCSARTILVAVPEEDAIAEVEIEEYDAEGDFEVRTVMFRDTVPGDMRICIEAEVRVRDEATDYGDYEHRYGCVTVGELRDRFVRSQER